MCFPSKAALTDHSSCVPIGVEMYTASIFLSDNTSSYKPNFLQLNSFENSFAFSMDLLPMNSNFENSDLMMAGITECLAILEQPIIPNLTGVNFSIDKI